MVWNQTIDYNGLYAHTDLEAYRAMAQAAPGFAAEITAPFAYRILVPWLSGTLFPTDVLGFQFFALLGMGLLSLQVYRMLQNTGASKQLALFLSVLLLFQPYLSGFVFFNPFQAADALSLALLLIMIEAVQRRAYSILLLAMIPAVATRENTLLILPFIVVYCLHQRDHRRLLLSLLSTVPGLVLWFSIHQIVPITNATYSLLQLFVDYAPDAAKWEIWVRVLLNACTPLALLVLVWWREARRFVREYPGYAMLVVAFFVSSWVAGDKERMMSPSFIIILFFLQKVHEWKGIFHHQWFVWLLFFASILSSMHFMWASLPIPNKVLYYSLCIVLEIVLALAALRLSASRPRLAGLDESNTGDAALDEHDDRSVG